MTAPHSAKHWTGCTCGGDRPCRVHPEKPSDGALWSLEEFRADEVELIARQFHAVISEHLERVCPACRGTFLLGSQRLKELGVVPK